MPFLPEINKLAYFFAAFGLFERRGVYLKTYQVSCDKAKPEGF